MDDGRVATALAATTTETASSSGRFILDKPLHELTEDDVSQLTREDCRRYLHDKGMRRPSWNKSQAIQQVISLKSLLEPPPPSPERPSPPPLLPEIPSRISGSNTVTGTSSSCSSLKDSSTVGVEATVSVLEASREMDNRKPAVKEKAVPQRSSETTHLSQGEMTILYSGKVNVYERVPADQAQTILHLAASPIQLLRDEPTSRHSAKWAVPMQIHQSNTKFSVVHSHSMIPQPILTDVDGQLNRQVCLQKYREKKKDRHRFKGRERVGPSGLELYFNHQIRTHGMNMQSSGSRPIPNHPGQIHRLPSFLDNLRKHPDLSVVVKDKA